MACPPATATPWSRTARRLMLRWRERRCPRAPCRMPTGRGCDAAPPAPFACGTSEPWSSLLLDGARGMARVGGPLCVPCFDVAPTPSPSEVPAMSHGRQKLVIRLRLRPPCCVFLPSHLLSLFLHLITMPVLEATPRQTSQAVLQPGTVASCQGSTACTTQASKASEASKATHRLMAARDSCALASLLRKKSVRNKHIRKTGR